MADYTFEGFLVLTGGQQVSGETKATAVEEGAIEIEHFDLGCSTDLEEEFRVENEGTDAEEQWGTGHLLGTDVEGMGRDSVKDVRIFSITKDLDKSSPALFQAYCSSSDPAQMISFSKAKVILRRMEGTKTPYTFVTFEFEDVSVLSYSIRCTGVERPEEDIDFYFRTCTFEYVPETADGAGSPLARIWKFA
ncbi:Hypothetical protein PBC10988_36590 [Planctomycetales bacterium 10988]|nr:Hypothetical protein PBC10988_36590 [Planctomycetales bacterium 10988]